MVVTVEGDDPGLAPFAVLYMIAPGKFTIMDPFSAMTAYGYAQSLPSDPRDIAGRYAMHGLLSPGWVLLAANQHAVGLSRCGEGAQRGIGFEWQLPNATGKGTAGNTAPFYVVSADKLLFMAGMLDRIIP